MLGGMSRTSSSLRIGIDRTCRYQHKVPYVKSLLQRTLYFSRSAEFNGADIMFRRTLEGALPTLVCDVLERVHNILKMRLPSFAPRAARFCKRLARASEREVKTLNRT